MCSLCGPSLAILVFVGRALSRFCSGGYHTDTKTNVGIRWRYDPEDTLESQTSVISQRTKYNIRIPPEVRGACFSKLDFLLKTLDRQGRPAPGAKIDLSVDESMI